jgi:hypothetical protein
MISQITINPHSNTSSKDFSTASQFLRSQVSPTSIKNTSTASQFKEEKTNIGEEFRENEGNPIIDKFIDKLLDDSDNESGGNYPRTIKSPIPTEEDSFPGCGSGNSSQ